MAAIVGNSPGDVQQRALVPSFLPCPPRQSHFVLAGLAAAAVQRATQTSQTLTSMPARDNNIMTAPLSLAGSSTTRTG
jgi:hypothetical protein